MFDVVLPEYAKDLYDGYLLLKFTRTPQHQKDFLDGKIFFNTSDFFARCDANGVGDHDEGMAIIAEPSEAKLVTGEIEEIDGEMAIVFRDYSNAPDKYPGLKIYNISPAVNRRRKLVSLYSMFVNLQSNVISPFSDDMPSEFGEYGILIRNRYQFFERVGRAIQQNEGLTDGMMGFINYKTQNEMQGIVDWQPFLKRKKFAYQNEFRFTFINQTQEPFFLELDCDLRDIAVPVCTSKFIKEAYLKEGTLNFPIDEYEGAYHEPTNYPRKTK